MPLRRKTVAVPSEEEVQRRWVALTVEQREAITVFDDPILVDRVKCRLQDLFKKHQTMQQLGLASADPFEDSNILTCAFQFTWQRVRSRTNPSTVREPDRQLGPVLVMKEPMLERDGLLHELRSTLPDFLSQNCGRAPMPRARWKELFANEPSSIEAVERQLVKLVEQALWAMAVDPAYAAPNIEEVDESNPLVNALEGDSVPFEPWMACDVNPKAGDVASKKKKKAKKEKGKKRPSLPGVDKADEAADEEEAEEQGHSEADDYIEDHDRWGFQLPKQHHADSSEHFARVAVEDAATATPTTQQSGAPFEAEGESDDESVGIGVFHLGSAASASELPSTMATAASTPGLPGASSSSAPAGGRNAALPRPQSRPLSQWRPVTPPCSPSGKNAAIHPPSLVCYIWNQTSRFAQGADSPQRARGGWATPGTSAGTPYPQNHQASTPLDGGSPLDAAGSSTPFLRRGQWLRPSGGTTPSRSGTPIMAVVRNTFIDINDHGEQSQGGASRPTRSCSPTWHSLCDRYWYEP